MTLVSSNAAAGSYSQNHILSLESQALIDSGFLPKIYKRYGRLFGVYDLLSAAGQVVNLPAQDVKVVELQAPTRPIKLRTAVSTGSAGASITINLHSDNFVNGKSIVRAGFTIVVPAKYQPAGVREDRLYVVTTIADGAVGLTNDVLTCLPLANGTTKTKSQISTEIPAGTSLALGPSTFGRGTLGTTGVVDYPVYRSYTTSVIKTAKTFDGGYLAYKAETMELNNELFSIEKARMEAEMELVAQKDLTCIWGEQNDNASLTQSAYFSGDTVSRRMSRGLFGWLDIAGQALYYTDKFAFSYFRTIKYLLQNQGIYTDKATIFCSPRFADDLYDEAKDYIREYSGGSNLWDAASGKVGFTPKAIEYGGMTYFINPVASLMRPDAAGLMDSAYDSVYATGDAAVVVPDAQVTVGKWGNESNVSIPNMWIGYVNNNGENRRNMMKRILGVNGVFSEDVVSTSADGFQYQGVSEFGFGGAEWNKMILIRKAKA